EVLADHRQRAGRAGLLQIGVTALEEVDVGQYRQAGGAAGFVAAGNVRRHEIGANHALAGGGLLDLGDDRRLAALRPLPQGAGKAARRVRLFRQPLQLGQTHAGPPLGHFLALAGNDLVEHAHCTFSWRNTAVKDTSSCSLSRARPLNSASWAIWTPSLRLPANPATYRAAPALSTIRSAAFWPFSVLRRPRASLISASDSWASLTVRPIRLWLLMPKSSGRMSYSVISPFFSSATCVGAARLISSRPSLECTTMTCSLPRRRSTSAMWRHSSLLNTPSTWRFSPAGLAIGPRMLNRVRRPSSRRALPAWRMAPWWDGANMKPTPTVSMLRATCSGVRSRKMPAASSRSALPLLPDTARLPCLATLPPPAATTKDAALETLKMFMPSPPVPQLSTRVAPGTRTGVASSRMTSTAPTISSMLSLFMRRPMRKAPICASVH